jgi:two-component system nitrate/nitrite response regulator NarL
MTTDTLPATSEPRPRSGDAPLKVVIADDHPLFRRGLARTIHRSPAFELVGEAADGREALELIDALEPDVAVLDHRMPELSGAEVCARLRVRPAAGRTRVLLLSAFEDADIVASAVASGAAGYVGKSASQGDICLAIERVGRGGIAYLDASP